MMKKLSKMIFGLSVLAVMPAMTYAEVIEIATFKLKDGVSYQQFAPLDKAVETEHVVKQPGFISREAAKGQNGEWLVVVHWESEEAAEASMKSFMNVKAAGDFMSHIDASTMNMKNYTKE
ncbi:hypothetical protein GPLA_2244 [Paraglaciecola polaris LMG 21857]|uniref:ABM domain-containing protein n=2 Tax=Paraglaciecola polaris TaxID=222814 RepID=K6YKB4_9ALTE|nr:hypothetical protein GPLA_2244 [Paraglaciecola polaris LMG 21857]|tara:strand:+ start:7302 stop:7661 length:360 start_codon:yes stop_codon:yes gene_type:complete